MVSSSSQSSIVEEVSVVAPQHTSSTVSSACSLVTFVLDELVSFV